MKAVEALGVAVTQAEFAVIIGVSEAKVSQLMAEGVIERGQTAHAWLLAYCARQREVAAGRASAEGGDLDLVQERAGLARAQRVAQELKNAIARREYAPIALVTDVLSLCGRAISDRLDQLGGMLRKSCPEMTDEGIAVAVQLEVGARNDCIRYTTRRVNDYLAGLEQSPDDGEGEGEGEQEDDERVGELEREAS